MGISLKNSKVKALLILVFAAIFAIAMVSLTGCSDDSSDSSSTTDASDYEDLDSVTLIMADGTGKGAAGNLWGEAITENVSEITGGKLTIDYHPNGELGGDTDLLRQEQADDIQMVITQPSTMISFIPELAVFDLPLAFTNYDPDDIEYVLNGDNEFTQTLQEDFEENGFYDLGWLQNGTYRVTTSNTELQTLDDFAGFQVRTMENSNQMAFWSALGAEPTPLAFSEVYFALQNGTVDGEENATDTIVGSSFQEVQKYIELTNHLLYVNNVSINKDAWDSLDPAYQDALKEAIQEATDTLRPQLTEINDENLQTIEDAGVEVIEYDDSFYDDVLANPGVQKLYEDINDQTDGLSNKLLDALDNAAN